MAKFTIKTPYFGIEDGFQKPYSEAEAAYFFGREKDEQIVKDLLRKGHCLTIISTAQAGKTSFLKAALIHDLKENGLLARAGKDWRIAYFQPKEQPVEALVKAVSQPGILYQHKVRPNFEDNVRQTINDSKNNNNGLIHLCESADTLKKNNLLLVIDNFGSSLNKKVSKKDKEKFFNLIINAAYADNIPLYILIVVNKFDLLSSEISDYPDLLKLIRTNQYSLHPLQESELLDVIRKPAQKGVTINGIFYEVSVSDDFCEKIITEIGDGPDKLKKLHHLMQIVWKRFLGEGNIAEGIHAKHFYLATGKNPVASKKVRKAKNTLAEDKSEVVASDLDLSTIETQEENVIVKDVASIYNDLSDSEKAIIKRLFQLLYFKKEKNSVFETREISPELLVTILQIDKKSLVEATNSFSGILEVSANQIRLANEEIEEYWPIINHWTAEETINILNYQNLSEATKKHYLESQAIETIFSKPELNELIEWDNQFGLSSQKEWANFFNAKDYELTVGFLTKCREMLGEPLPKKRVAPKQKAPAPKAAKPTNPPPTTPPNKKQPQRRIKINTASKKTQNPKETAAPSTAKIVPKKRKKIVIKRK